MRNYTLGERAIIYIAIQDGASLEEINEALLKEQTKTKMSKRELPISSYDMVKKSYLKLPGTLWEKITKPKSLGANNA